jgi:glycosyltransferase involved in cell wall biosynthesis/peptidoglycan/xylan/chitin deacetylase (PgdA/CDA1 family)
MNIEQDVTVVCPTYNSAAFISASLHSVAMQTQKPAEVVVVDDGSSDATCEVVERFARTAPFRVRLLRQPHRGPGAARNAGVRAASTKWVAFLDSDDLWFSEKLERVAAKAQQMPAVQFFCHHEENWRIDGRNKLMDFARGVDLSRPIVPQLYRRNFFTPSAVVCCREPLVACGLFDETFPSAQDYELWMRLAPRVKIAFIEEVLGAYVERQGSISSGSPERRAFHAGRIFWKHRGQVGATDLVRAIHRLGFSILRQRLERLYQLPIRRTRSSEEQSQTVGVTSRPLPISRTAFSWLYSVTTLRKTPYWGTSQPKGPRVLLFHDVPEHDEQTFHRLLATLATEWQFITPEAFVALMKDDTPVQTRSLLLTFDDGFRSNHRVAKRVLASLGVKAVFFVPSEFVVLHDRAAQESFIADRIFDGKITRDAVPRDMSPMTIAELRELVAMGHTIGSHTCSHARLSRLICRATLKRELRESADRLGELLNQRISMMAYPFGNVDSINARVLQQCHGIFDFVFSGVRGFNSSATPRLAIRRDSFQPSDPAIYVRAMLYGAADRIYTRSAALLDQMAESND